MPLSLPTMPHLLLLLLALPTLPAPIAASYGDSDPHYQASLNHPHNLNTTTCTFSMNEEVLGAPPAEGVFHQTHCTSKVFRCVRDMCESAANTHSWWYYPHTVPNTRAMLLRLTRTLASISSSPPALSHDRTSGNVPIASNT